MVVARVVTRVTNDLTYAFSLATSTPGAGDRRVSSTNTLPINTSSVPATIESIIQPDPIKGKLDMKIVGVMHQSSLLWAPMRPSSVR